MGTGIHIRCDVGLIRIFIKVARQNNIVIFDRAVDTKIIVSGLDAFDEFFEPADRELVPSAHRAKSIDLRKELKPRRLYEIRVFIDHMAADDLWALECVKRFEKQKLETRGFDPIDVASKSSHH